mmetsp:Transcript_5237/g.10660  ORF Transcript_5237/g.10660 Transcript_5237/m.10660 type:complete len:293 (+) Transcript_5237:2-880(+)
MGYRINEMVHGIAVGFVYASLVEFDGLLANWVGNKGGRAMCTPPWLVLLMEGHPHHGSVEVRHRHQSDESTNTNYNDNNDDGGNSANDNHHQRQRHNPQQQILQYDVALEPGANILHRAAAMGNLQILQRELERAQRRVVDSINASNTSNYEDDDNTFTSTAIFNETKSFRQQDRNGWQPLHEAARGGHVSASVFLLELEQVIEGEGRSNNENNDEGNRRHWRRKQTQQRALNVDVNARTNSGRGCTALWLAEKEHGQGSGIANMIRLAGGISLGYGDDDNNARDNHVFANE